MTPFQVFTLPGRVIAWFGYMFAKPGDIWTSGRRVDSPGVHLLFSLVFYAGVLFLGLSALTSSSRASPDRSEPVAPQTFDEAQPLAGFETHNIDAPSEIVAEDSAPETPAPGLVGEDQDKALAKTQAPVAFATNTDGSGEPKAGQKPTAIPATSADETPGELAAAIGRILDSGPAPARSSWGDANLGGQVEVTGWTRTADGICRRLTYTVEGPERRRVEPFRQMCRRDGGWREN